MAYEFKTAFQLEEMIADLAGFNATSIHVSKVGNAGDFRATMVGTVAAVSASRAQSDIDAISAKLRLKFRLRA
jgi:hypothetical protein